MAWILSSHRAAISWQPHHDPATPYDLSLIESAGVSVLCCILFYTFEVLSQLKMSSCTRLVHKCHKIHEDHTATVQSPHGLRTEALHYLCDFYAWLRRQHDDCTISTRSVYGFAPVCCRKPSKKVHDNRIKCKYIRRSLKLTYDA